MVLKICTILGSIGKGGAHDNLNQFFSVFLLIKGCGFQCTYIYAIFTSLKKFRNHTLFCYVFESVSNTLSYVKE